RVLVREFRAERGVEAPTPGETAVVEEGGFGILHDDRFRDDRRVLVIEKGVDSVIGFAHLPLYWEAKLGTLDKGKTYGNISALLSPTASIQQMAVRGDSNIKSFADLKNKRINCGKKGTGGEITCLRLLETYGITYDSVRANGGQVSFLDHTEMGIALKDRTLDFTNLSGEMPHSVLVEAETTTPIRLLNIDKPNLDALQKKYPYYTTTKIPAKTLKGTPNDVTALVNAATLIVNNKGLSDEFVYEVVKLIMTKAKDFQAALPFMNLLVPPAKALDGLKPELMHPASIRYFKGIGVLK
ncbi:MAG: TAXI family TRAP transporter solute-binding subunit, partial [Proteobacteria bacterium]|nr:TAXI family TRAP transporter solute-binding subunit [Pseudomonadota bacterium]